mmetsp:Transcript_27694/g.42948  ORF Transcript_27694/g.42948 Transcript_27694/m.42948 type:complete len:147 (-) Transcript_27694:288-728(-)
MWAFFVKSNPGKGSIISVECRRFLTKVDQCWQKLEVIGSQWSIYCFETLLFVVNSAAIVSDAFCQKWRRKRLRAGQKNSSFIFFRCNIISTWSQVQWFLRNGLSLIATGNVGLPEKFMSFDSLTRTSSCTVLKLDSIQYQWSITGI